MLKKILSLFQQPEQPQTRTHADILSEARAMYRRFGTVYKVDNRGLLDRTVEQALAENATQSVEHLSVYGVTVAAEYGVVQDGDFNVTPDLLVKHLSGTEVFFVFEKRPGTFSGDIAEQIIVEGITYKGEQAALHPVTELMLPTRQIEVQFLTPATRPHVQIAQEVCMDLLDYLLELGTNPNYKHYVEKRQIEVEIERLNVVIQEEVQDELDSRDLLVNDAPQTPENPMELSEEEEKEWKKGVIQEAKRQLLVVLPDELQPEPTPKPAKTPKVTKIIKGILGKNPVYSFVPTFLFRTIGAELAKNGMNPEAKVGEVIGTLYEIDAEWTKRNADTETLIQEMNEGAKANL